MKFTRLKNIKERRDYSRQDTDLVASFKEEGTDNFIPARIVNMERIDKYRIAGFIRSMLKQKELK